jgi:hypothetical protein
MAAATDAVEFAWLCLLEKELPLFSIFRQQAKLALMYINSA